MSDPGEMAASHRPCIAGCTLLESRSPALRPRYWLLARWHIAHDHISSGREGTVPIRGILDTCDRDCAGVVPMDGEVNMGEGVPCGMVPLVTPFSSCPCASVCSSVVQMQRVVDNSIDTRIVAHS